MFCGQCGGALQEGQAYCGGCGSPSSSPVSPGRMSTAVADPALSEPGGWGSPGAPSAAPAQPPSVPYPEVQIAQAPPTSGMAIASMVMGILWLGGIGAVLALIFGYKAWREIDGSGGRIQGRGMATAGVVLGWVGVAGALLWIVWIIIVLAAIGHSVHQINNFPTYTYSTTP